MSSETVGRFAPSPSGRMHLGNAFSCLMAWLSARAADGRIILRHEDLDPARCRRDYAEQIEDDLHWLGLDWDEGGSQGGSQYYQSCRGEFYEHYLAALEKKGLIYPCFCTRADLHAASAPHTADGTPIYSGACRDLSPQQRQERAALRSPALRARVPAEAISFRDGLQGMCCFQLQKDCGDFILRRSDGVFAYQLAVVVDDALMGVTQVVRGRDLLSSTPWQLWLQQQLGFSAPEYYHVPLLAAGDGRRLSKRDGDMDLGTLRASGVSPQSITGRLAYLAGLIDREEELSPRELIPLFRWDKIRKENIAVK
ncbi:MAG: tRNA glutamyl-Q(34) synthetase GluQRS [Candidatus Limivicinus sp.]